MSRTVLLVEDEDDTRELLGRALSRAGYTPVLAATAEAALELARREPPAVVVTDIVLGRDDRRGLRLIAELRTLGVTAKIIVITAFADVEKVKFALNEGASHLLEKPFSAGELVAALEKVHAPSDPADHAEQLFSRAQLTEKERTVARHLLRGLSSSEIAEELQNSPKTIRQHVSQIYAKCGVESRAALFRLVYVR